MTQTIYHAKNDKLAVEHPAVTIVIPCRNEAHYIEECLRGVLAFDSPPGGFEVIVADGMSDDGTRDIVARIANADPRVRLLDNPKRNTPCALNVGSHTNAGESYMRVDSSNCHCRC